MLTCVLNLTPGQLFRAHSAARWHLPHFEQSLDDVARIHEIVLSQVEGLFKFIEDLLLDVCLALASHNRVAREAREVVVAEAGWCLEEASSVEENEGTTREIFRF